MSTQNVLHNKEIETMTIRELETLIEWLTVIKNKKISDVVKTTNKYTTNKSTELISPINSRILEDFHIRSTTSDDNTYMDPNTFAVNTRTGNKTWSNPYEYSKPKSSAPPQILPSYHGKYLVDGTISPYGKSTTTDPNYRDSIIESTLRQPTSNYINCKKGRSQQEIDRFESDKLQLECNINNKWQNRQQLNPAISSRSENIRYV